MLANLLPMKTWMSSLGLVIAVASAKESGWTVGKVDIAALDKLYGNGHNRIMHKILIPSCFSVRAKASNRLSCPTNLFTYFDRTVLDARKAAVEPATVADATINQPFGNPYTKPAIVMVVL